MEKNPMKLSSRAYTKQIIPHKWQDSEQRLLQNVIHELENYKFQTEGTKQTIMISGLIDQQTKATLNLTFPNVTPL